MDLALNSGFKFRERYNARLHKIQMVFAMLQLNHTLYLDTCILQMCRWFVASGLIRGWDIYLVLCRSYELEP